MRKPSLSTGAQVVTALLVLIAACARAQFEPKADGASPDVAEVGADTREVAAPPDAAVCPASPVSGCTPVDGGPCNPVCQTGNCDWCTQKCAYVYEPSIGREAVACVPKGKGVFPQSCERLSAGSSVQSDDCAPGSICLEPTIGATATYCFTLCRTFLNCPNVECGIRPLSAVGGEVAVCDPSYDQCGPDGTCCDPLRNTGCDPDRTCLLVSPDSGTGRSRTVCEFAVGDGRDGASCVTARDCMFANTCVDNRCWRVCSDDVPCPNEGRCVAHGSEFGYCP